MTVSNLVTYPLPNAAENAKQARIVGKNGDTTDKEMFLKLMMAQLKNQDPTAPMDQKDMMASITQFSQMEQMQNMSTAMETLSLTQGVGMIGKEINFTSVIKDAEGRVVREVEASGTVDHVEQSASGGVFLVLTGAAGERIKPSAVTKVFG